MRLRLERNPIIDNVRNHPAEMVEKLRDLLLAGAPAYPDPHRKNFYELENCSKVYYIHFSPVNGKVMFLAVWDNDKAEKVVPEKVSETLSVCCRSC